MANPAVVVDFLANTKDFVRDMRKASGQAESFGSKLGTLAKGAAIGGLAAAGTAAVAFGAKAISAASDLNESMNAVNVTFGDAAGSVQQFSKHAAQLGLSMNEVNSLIVPVGASLQNLGYSQEEAAKQSVVLTKRAADMASVFNTSVPDAMEAVQAGLRGEADPLERYGVGLSDAAVTAKALAMHLAATKKELTAQNKAQARVALLMEQTNKFAGDFSNTSDGLANRQRILKAQFDNVTAAVGMKLLPAITDAVSYIVKHWPEIQTVIFKVWRAIKPTIQTLGEIVLELGGVVVDVVKLIIKHWGTIGPIVENVLAVFTGALKVIAGVIKVVADLLRGDWAQAWADMKDTVLTYLDTLKRELLLLPQVFLVIAKAIGKAILDGIVAVLNDLGDSVRARITAEITFGTEILNAIRTRARTLGNEIIGGVVGPLDDIGDKVRHAINVGVSFGEEILGAMETRAKAIGGRIVEGAVSLVSEIGEKIRSAVNAGVSFGEEILAAMSSRAAAIGNRIVSGAVGVLGEIGERVRSAISGGISFGEEFLTAIYNKAVTIGGKLKDGIMAGVHGLSDLLVGIVTRAINGVIDVINKFHIPSFKIPHTKIKFGGFGFNIAHLARGGVVSSPTLAMVGEGGAREIVSPEPLLRSLLAENTPQVHVYIGDRELTDLVRVEVVTQNNRTAQTLLAGAL